MAYEPLTIKDCSGTYTISAADSDVVLRFERAGVVSIPADDGSIPVGFQAAIESIQSSVVVSAGAGVLLGGSGGRIVGALGTGVLVKENANFWLLSLGTAGGGGGGASPLPPTNVSAGGLSAGAQVLWSAPEDDGGFPVTSYIVEMSTDGKSWASKAVTQATVFSAVIDSLTPGTSYQFRVKAVNQAGVSDPSEIASAVPSQGFNQAEGGTVTEYEKDGRRYKVHTFSSDGTFNVLKSFANFRVLTVGSGGGGGGGNAYYSNGGPGGGGEPLDKSQALPVGAYTVKPGTLGTIQVSRNGGRGGDAYLDGGQYKNGAAGTSYGSIKTSISGTEVTVPGPVGSPSGQTCLVGGNGVAPGGGGGGGGGNSNDLCGAKPGGPGAAGVTVVSYEIAPWNEAAGGVVNEFFYSSDGTKWRTHTFTSGGTLTVTSAPNPFRVLVVGGGGGAQRSPGTGWNSGNGGGGEVKDVTTQLSLGNLVATVGGGGSGGAGGATSDNEPGGPGGQSGVAQVTSQGGGGGGAGGYAGPAKVSDITGVNVTYSGNKGAGGATGTPATLFGEGSGHATGGGGGGGANYSPGGKGGIVIVSYQIG
jgi:hypothetical protein